MIITLKTPHQTLSNIFNVPLVGAFILFIIALLPVPVWIIMSAIFHFHYNGDDGVIQLIVAGWNLLLAYVVNVKIGIFFIPCWVLFGAIGILKVFSII